MDDTRKIYDELRCQRAADPQRLDFELLRQLWLYARGDGRVPPSNFARAVLHAMALAFLLAEGRSELEAAAEQSETISMFEREYQRLFEGLEATTGQPRMCRTRWPMNGNVVLFRPRPK